MMHPWQVNTIVANAFNGMGDSTGSDEFGYSVAWIDLEDFVEPYGETEAPQDADELSAALVAYVGNRWALAYLDADGTRSVVGYLSREDMMLAYREHEAKFLAFEEEPDEED